MQGEEEEARQKAGFANRAQGSDFIGSMGISENWESMFFVAFVHFHVHLPGLKTRSPS